MPDERGAGRSALEDRLRRALTDAAPEALPTIGIRERLIAGVCSRHRRRQKTLGAIAVTVVVLAGATAGVVSLGHGAPGGRATASASQSEAPLANRPAGSSAEELGGVSTRARATSNTSDCALVLVDGVKHDGCDGAFALGTGSVSASSTESSNHDDVTFGQSSTLLQTQPGSTATGVTNTNSANPTASTVANGARYNASASSSSASAANANVHHPVTYTLVVPLGRAVTIVMPRISGQIWTAPSIAPGQGEGAVHVRITDAHESRPGKSSYATLESSSAVTVVVDASVLDSCGGSACGSPVESWNVVLEFQG